MHMRIFLLLLISLFSVPHLKAQEQMYLNIVLKDKSCVSYEVVSSTAYITFNDSCMRVNYVDFFLKDIVKYYVSEEDNAITGIKNTSFSGNRIVGNNLYVTTQKIGTIKLYDMSGKCILTQKIDDSYSIIDLSTLQKGTYIVWINKESFKFTKR